VGTLISLQGVVVTKTPELSEKIKFIQNSSGAVLGPFDSWLLIRGIETLALRVEKHASNAQKVAAFLNTQSFIGNLYYPGLESHTTIISLKNNKAHLEVLSHFH
jgi:cystathionine gamma-lyase/homocysteine desulfhydrase